MHSGHPALRHGGLCGCRTRTIQGLLMMTELQTGCVDPRPFYVANVEAQCFVKAPCGRWQCPACGRRKARKVARRAALIQPTHLFTVSLPRAAGVEEWHDLLAAYRTFIRWMK